ncbi:hypothetical protein D3C78_565680 [compost metagenome]
MVTVLGFQGQVQLRSAGVPLQCFDREAWQRQRFGLTRGALVVVHGLEQRVVAEAALRLQRLDQLLERQLLMLLGTECRFLGVLQQFEEGAVRAEVRFEHLGIDEEADQTLGFQAIAVGDRHADADVILTAVAMQQGLERGQKQHEQGDFLRLGQLAQLLDQALIQLQVDPPTTGAQGRRAWVVGRQFEHALGPGQLRGPVVQLALTLTGGHPLPLPHCVVGVLDCQGR